jgi:hypothetical protein
LINKGASRHSNKLGPKSLPNIWIKVESKDENMLLLEAWKRGEVYNKYEDFWATHHERIMKTTYTSLNLENISSKTLWKKE